MLANAQTIFFCIKPYKIDEHWEKTRALSNPKSSFGANKKRFKWTYPNGDIMKEMLGETEEDAYVPSGPILIGDNEAMGESVDVFYFPQTRFPQWLVFHKSLSQGCQT